MAAKALLRPSHAKLMRSATANVLPNGTRRSGMSGESMAVSLKTSTSFTSADAPRRIVMVRLGR